MSSGVRKLVRAVHLTCSVGWLGAVVAYIPLDLTAALSDDPQLVRAVWVSMGLLAERAVVPLAVAALVTGVTISVSTPWGLFRHWWVVISLALTLVALSVLLVEAGLISRNAAIASNPDASTEQLFALGTTLPHSIGGLVVLVTVQVLNVYKPRGLTPYGWRVEARRRAAGPS